MKIAAAGMFVVTCAALDMPTTAQTSKANLLGRIDHLVFATPDLATGIARVEQLLGVRATPGGQHPGRGTRNALVALGPRAYIEIIGPDPDQPAPKEPRPFGIDRLTAPRLVTWAANEHDLPRLSQLATKAGIPLGSLASGSRQRPDGVLLTWNYTDPRVVVAEGIVPFFIDWGKTPHPADSAVNGGRIVALAAEHPQPDAVTKSLRALGLDLAVAAAATPALVAVIETPRGRVEIR
jgi:hypothetical protein